MISRVNEFYDTLINFFVNKPTYITFIYLVILIKIFPLLFVSIPIIFGFDTESNPNPDDIASFYSIFCLVVLIPIIETFIGQYLPIVLLLKNKYIQNNKWIAVLISSVIFGIGHTQSLSYIFFGFGAGLVLAMGYMVMIKKYNVKAAFCIVSGIHAMANSISLSLLSLVTTLQ